jgi:hypothetical protein
MAGNCDSGYSCVYSSALSWKSPTQPLPKEINPRFVFDRLFSRRGSAEQVRQNAARKSVLDYIHEDSRALLTRVGTGDRQKLD